MTDTEFFTRKNKIVKRVTGGVLIPDEQIVETGIKQVELGAEFDLDLIVLGDGICPYCIYFHTDNEGCGDCPMSVAGNKCDNKGSSWRKAKSKWAEKATKEDIQELRELCEQYNKEL